MVINAFISLFHPYDTTISYHAVRDDLAWCQPFSKFLTIKGVVFMTFWQGLAISIIFHASAGSNENESDDDDDSTMKSPSSIQHILICMEMLFFSVAHFCVFPAEEWEEGYKAKFFEGPGFGFRDFADDVAHVIDSGKRSMQARKDKKKDDKTEDSSREVNSFGSMDDADKDREDAFNENGTYA